MNAWISKNSNWLGLTRGLLVAQTVNKLPEMQETWV